MAMDYIAVFHERVSELDESRADSVTHKKEERRNNSMKEKKPKPDKKRTVSVSSATSGPF